MAVGTIRAELDGSKIISTAVLNGETTVSCYEYASPQLAFEALERAAGLDFEALMEEHGLDSISVTKSYRRQSLPKLHARVEPHELSS